MFEMCRNVTIFVWRCGYWLDTLYIRYVTSCTIIISISISIDSYLWNLNFSKYKPENHKETTKKAKRHRIIIIKINTVSNIWYTTLQLRSRVRKFRIYIYHLYVSWWHIFVGLRNERFSIVSFGFFPTNDNNINTYKYNHNNIIVLFNMRMQWPACKPHFSFNEPNSMFQTYLYIVKIWNFV